MDSPNRLSGKLQRHNLLINLVNQRLLNNHYYNQLSIRAVDQEMGRGMDHEMDLEMELV